MTDDDVMMTCYVSLGGARLHKSEFTLGRGNMGGLYKGGYGVLWGVSISLIYHLMIIMMTSSINESYL